jgi:hypothetical protein
MQSNRSRPGALVGGMLLIAFGLLSLSMRLLRFVDWGLLWPSVVIGFGMLFFVAMLAGGKQFAVLAIPGSFISGIGLMLLFQSLTGRWELISYFWTLIILFLGVGIYIMGSYNGDGNQKQSGMRVMKVGFVLFLIFGTFFEMIFSSFNNLLFPLLLIGLGVYIVLKRAGLFGGEVKHPSDSLPHPR